MKLDLLQFNQKYVLIKVSKKNTSICQIYHYLNIRYIEKDELRVSIFILLKSDNQGSITLTYNLVFYSKTKH